MSESKQPKNPTGHPTEAAAAQAGILPPLEDPKPNNMLAGEPEGKIRMVKVRTLQAIRVDDPKDPRNPKFYPPGVEAEIPEYLVGEFCDKRFETPYPDGGEWTEARAWRDREATSIVRAVRLA